MAGSTASFPWRDLERGYGPITRRHHMLTVGTGFVGFMAKNARKRDGEVVLVICRPDRYVLLHTKPFYPPDTWRMPSGGIERGEGLEAAARREIAEETGLPARLERLLGVLTYEVRGEEQQIFYASGVFLAVTPDVRPAAQDPQETISGYRWVPPAELKAIAAHLRQLPQSWSDWGKWRALAHDFAAACLG